MEEKKVIQVLYQDEHCLVVDKPAGLLAVPGRGLDKQDCVVKRIRQQVPRCIEQPAVHRLDMDTSGLMVLALTQQAHRGLSRAFSERQVQKLYAAVVAGQPTREAGNIRLKFRLDPNDRPRQVYDPVQGREGLSYWQRLRVYESTTLVAFKPITGRTHQLRLHASHPQGLACPIVGDRLYGTRLPGQRMLLHAAWLSFCHPVSGERLCYQSSPSFCTGAWEDSTALLEALFADDDCRGDCFSS